MNIRKILIIGFIFGSIAPFIGLFAGLQIAPILGNILMFPFIIVSMIMGEPIGNFSTLWKISYLSSILVWGFIFFSISKLRSVLKK